MIQQNTNENRAVYKNHTTTRIDYIIIM